MTIAVIAVIVALAAVIIAVVAYSCGHAAGWAGRREVDRMRAPVDRARGGEP